jgi:hypothetical protein
MLTNPEAILANIFTDPRWRELSGWRMFADIDGVKVGVVLATKSPKFDCFALNWDSIDRLLVGKHSGKLDVAYVVWPRDNGRNARTYCGCVEAELLLEKLKGLRPRDGQFGQFWVLPLDFAAGGILDDEPF